MRVIFVKTILEEYGFRVDVREDALIARMEDRDMEFMKRRLKVLGYLTIHTRQIDMIMSNSASVQHYRNMFRRDLHNLFEPQ